MSFFSTIKKNARLALRGHWGAAAGINVLVTMVMTALMFLEYMALSVFVIDPVRQTPTMEPLPFDLSGFTLEMFAFGWVELLITTVFVLMAFLLLSPLSLGLTRWFYVLAQGQSPEFGELFRFFETPRRYFRALWYIVQINLRCWLWGILFFAVPGGVMGVCVRFLSIDTVDRQTRAAASMGAALAVGLMILASLLYIIYTNKYALAAFLLCESDEITVREAIRSSVRYTKGYRGIITLFFCSFLGWFLLSPFTLFLLLLYAAPYYMAGQALLARYLTEKSRGQEPKDTQEFRRGYTV